MNLKTVLIASVAVVLVVVGVFMSLPSATDTSGSVSQSYIKTLDERIGKLEETVNREKAEGYHFESSIAYIESVVALAKSGLDIAGAPKGIESEHQALYDALDAMELACAGLYFDDYEADSEPEPVADPYQCYDKYDEVAEAWAAIKEKAEDR